LLEWIGMADEEGWPRSRPARAGRGPRTLTASEAAALIGVSVATVPVIALESVGEAGLFGRAYDAVRLWWRRRN